MYVLGMKKRALLTFDVDNNEMCHVPIKIVYKKENLKTKSKAKQCNSSNKNIHKHKHNNNNNKHQHTYEYENQNECKTKEERDFQHTQQQQTRQQTQQQTQIIKTMVTPCLLSDINEIESIEIDSRRYWNIQLFQNDIHKVIERGVFFTKKHIGYLDYEKDPKGMYVYMYVYMYVCMCVCMYVCVCMCVCMYVYECMYVCI